MKKCLECKQDCKKEYYVPTSHGEIYPFCSEECGNAHSDKLVESNPHKYRLGNPQIVNGN